MVVRISFYIEFALVTRHLSVRHYAPYCTHGVNIWNRKCNDLAAGAIAEADPRACPYASNTVIVLKSDGSFKMCVDTCDLSAVTRD